MSATLPLKRMSKADKLRALEALWLDLSTDGEGVDSPRWHADALEQMGAVVAPEPKL